ncbi:hypothetical protein JCM19233_5797 [Vibrio astriarenae]|uniref:DUF2897 family protein n=1 Tax=Vibrio astriarenae TaxID=1481923 RepID=UPI0005008FB0|nr:hypothetical protein JCM19233_5797 [Vibrio sp. C7]
MSFLTNPWVISILAMGFILGNILALRKVSQVQMRKTKTMSDLEKLSELEKKNKQRIDAIENSKQEAAPQKTPNENDKADS